MLIKPQVGMMLNTDIELFYDVQQIDDNGRAGCTLPNSSTDLPKCAKFSSFKIGKKYSKVSKQLLTFAS